MAESSGPEMSRQEFSIAYNGKGRLDDHSIDVDTLAPALLAFGKLIREGNQEFNGKNVRAKVYVTSDFEHKCFNINFEAVLSLVGHIKSIFGDDTVKTAKDVLEWIGIVRPTVIAGLSYLSYLLIKRGRKVVEKKELTDEDRSGLVSVKFEGDGNSVVVHNHVYKLSENPRALKATRDAFIPIGLDGFDRLEIRDHDAVIEEFDPVSTQSIIASCNAGLLHIDDPEPDIEETSAWLSVYSPVYDLSADKWRFRFGKEVVYADISETMIAQDALNRGGAMADDSYQVRLEITFPLDKSGKRGTPTYKITEVVKFVPANPLSQASLF